MSGALLVTLGSLVTGIDGVANGVIDQCPGFGWGRVNFPL